MNILEKPLMIRQRKAKHYRIIVMDSDVKTAKQLVSVLCKEGYRAENIEQTSRLFEKIRSNLIDVLILDVDAWYKRGYELIPIVKSMDRLLPIIVTSADDSIEVAAKVREQGIFFYTMKPLDMQEIKIALKNALNRRYTSRYTSGLGKQEKLGVVDTSEVIRDNAEMCDINKHLNWIMAFFVHECKGTLGSVMMNISALADANISQRISPAKQNAMLLSSLCSLGMLHDMIRNYVISYRGENKRLQCSRRRVDVYKRCLEPVINEFRPMLKKNEMSINVDMKGNRFFYCDADLMKIGFSNLINNAIKYGTACTDIRCKSLTTDEIFRLSIWNEGIGVERERLDDIFERFIRFDKVGINGTGLGLHVVKMIANVHNGSVKAESGYLITDTSVTYDEFYSNPRLAKTDRTDLKKFARFIFEIPSSGHQQKGEV